MYQQGQGMNKDNGGGGGGRDGGGREGGGSGYLNQRPSMPSQRDKPQRMGKVNSDQVILGTRPGKEI